MITTMKVSLSLKFYSTKNIILMEDVRIWKKRTEPLLSRSEKIYKNLKKI